MGGPLGWGIVWGVWGVVWFVFVLYYDILGVDRKEKAGEYQCTKRSFTNKLKSLTNRSRSISYILYRIARRILPTPLDPSPGSGPSPDMQVISCLVFFPILSFYFLLTCEGVNKLLGKFPVLVSCRSIIPRSICMTLYIAPPPSAPARSASTTTGMPLALWTQK